MGDRLRKPESNRKKPRKKPEEPKKEEKRGGYGKTGYSKGYGSK